MKIDVRFRGFEPSEALRDHALRRIRLHLSRFADELTSVRLRISDLNGPKGGLDKQCQVTVRGPRATINVDGLTTDAYSAVDVATERSGRAVGRRRARGRGHHDSAASNMFALEPNALSEED